jgi:hypothetical protein
MRGVVCEQIHQTPPGVGPDGSHKSKGPKIEPQMEKEDATMISGTPPDKQVRRHKAITFQD